MEGYIIDITTPTRNLQRSLGDQSGDEVAPIISAYKLQGLNSGQAVQKVHSLAIAAKNLLQNKLAKSPIDTSASRSIPKVPVEVKVTTNNSESNASVVNGDVVNGRASRLVQPTYPSAAKAVRASGTVNVQVLIDEKGNVISASAVTGHPLLRTAAEEAASQSKFSPMVISGRAVKVKGIIVYNFVGH